MSFRIFLAPAFLVVVLVAIFVAPALT